MAKAATLRTLSDDQLLDELESARKELFNLRFAFATSQLDNSAKISVTRRDIARIHTVLREREIAAAEALLSTTPTSAVPADATQSAEASHSEAQDEAQDEVQDHASPASTSTGDAP